MTHIIRTDEKKKEYCDLTLTMEEGARAVYLMLAERLYNIRQERLYEPYWSSWQEFNMEFKDLAPSSISKLITVYETFVLKFGYKPSELSKAGGWTKLYQMTKQVKSKADADKWLALGETHSRQDLDKYLVEAKTGVDMSGCPHAETYTVVICTHCGERVAKYDTELSPSSLL